MAPSLSAEPINAQLFSSPPIGVLRPPVAVGLPDDDDAYAVGRNSPRGHSFGASHGSGASGGGWSFPASYSHGGAWNASPVFAGNSSWNAESDGYHLRISEPLAQDYNKSSGAGAIGAGNGWGIVEQGFELADPPGSGTTAGVAASPGAYAPSDLQCFTEPHAVEQSIPMARKATTFANAGRRYPVTEPYAPAVSSSAWPPSAAPRAVRTVPAVPTRIPAQLTLAEKWVANHAPLPVGHTPIVTYPGGASVSFPELAASLTPIALANAQHRARIIPAIESGDVLRQTLRTYAACDRDRSGFLSWYDGQIQNFISSVFQQLGLTPPDDQQMFQLYTKFDVDRNRVLDARECLCLVDALFRSIFFKELPRTMYGPQQHAFPVPQPPVPMPLGHVAVAPPPVFHPPLAHAGPVHVVHGYPAAPAVHGYPAAHAVHAPWAPVVMPAPAPHVVPVHHVPVTHHQPQFVEPLEAYIDEPMMDEYVEVEYVDDDYVSGSYSRYPPERSNMPEYVDDPPPSSQNMSNWRTSLSKAQRRAGGEALLPGPPGSFHPGKSLRPTRSDASIGRLPPSWAPSPNAPQVFQEEASRQHVLDLELTELELHPEAPELEPAWYEAVRYFVSFHPHTDHHNNFPVPRTAPRSTVDEQHLVSSDQPLTQSEVARFSSTASIGSNSSGGSIGNANPHVHFDESLSLQMKKLDSHLVAYLWGKKSSVANENVVLIGRSVLPLKDFKFQRHPTCWHVIGTEGHRVSELRLSYSVCTTPAQVQNPHITDAKRTEVTVKWSAPANDHGSKVVGYNVSILLDQKAQDGPQWFTLCECTKSANPIYVVTNLTGNTAYMMDIKAVNKVGVGDSCEFQITTAPVEPDAPTKPWIQEARDGCLNVAWGPSPSDGGLPITAYKVKMRKILGASKWNPFGPGESKATWAEMGTVGASMSEEDEPSAYNAWVGPLEGASCEYRFQIVALSQAGMSQGSELSEAYYT